MVTKLMWHVQVVDFGKLSFVEQIRTVHDAAVLAGISGSDLINAIFLPSRGILVELDPANRGAQVRFHTSRGFDHRQAWAVAGVVAPTRTTGL